MALLRHSNKTMIYCGRLQSPTPALSAKNVLDVPQHASGPFSPAALAFSLDLVTNLVLLECLRMKALQAPGGCLRLIYS